MGHKTPSNIAWSAAPWACGHADPVYMGRDTQECAICGLRRHAPGSWTAIAARLDALDTRMRRNADAYARIAGLGPERNVWANAMIALDGGTPWSGVDYAALREAVKIDERRLMLSRKRTEKWRAYDRARNPEWYAA